MPYFMVSCAVLGGGGYTFLKGNQRRSGSGGKGQCAGSRTGQSGGRKSWGQNLLYERIINKI